jgi:DNA-binding NtrC family response regulator
VGGTKLLTSDVRVIAATNRDLGEDIEKGTFRQDLFFRLNVAPIRLPPLRERLEDIPLLVKHFLSHSTFSQMEVEPGVLTSLQNHSWPGNVRELQHLITRATILAESGTIRVRDLGDFMSSARNAPIIVTPPPTEPPGNAPLCWKGKLRVQYRAFVALARGAQSSQQLWYEGIQRVVRAGGALSPDELFTLQDALDYIKTAERYAGSMSSKTLMNKVRAGSLKEFFAKERETIAEQRTGNPDNRRKMTLPFRFFFMDLSVFLKNDKNWSIVLRCQSSDGLASYLNALWGEQ